MRLAPSFVALAIVAAGTACHDGSAEPGLRQLAADASLDPGDAPLTDGVADATAPDDTVDAALPDAERDTAPLGCTDDAPCATARTCQIGRCEEGRCVFTAADDGAACDDGDPCTEVDTCQGGVCAGSGLLSCADDDPCTDDRCQPGQGCTFSPKVCDDGDACTLDSCRDGVGCVATPLDCPAATCTVARCDPTRGCVGDPAPDGTSCDDGDPCTGEVCVAGACAATPIGCDDGNPCTSDACAPGQGCSFEPIPNCATDEACLGRLPGAACDDRDPSTSADLCLLGSCRGFSLVRVPGDAVEDQEGMVVRAIDHDSHGWYAALWTLDLVLRQSHVLADVNDPATPLIDPDTLQDAAFSGLHDGFAGDADGRLWRRLDGGWDADTDWDEALDDSGRGRITALYSARDIKPGAATGALHLWLVGDDGDAWLRHCREEAGGVLCAEQTLGGDAASIPRALGGVPRCEASGACSSAWLTLGADAAVGGGFNFTDTYENATGLLATWTTGRIPESAANRATRAVAAFQQGGEAGPAALVVGDNGYLLHRRAEGGWSAPLVLREGQQGRDFSGVWVGAGVIVVSAHRLAPNNQTAMELWVAPLSSNLESGDSWVVHELGRFTNVEADGLYDVHGLPTGELRAVGAVRRIGGAFDWLDGAFWVRAP